MGIEGWYYLHENGDLIYKRDLGPGSKPEVEPGGFVRKVWKVDPSNRVHAWLVVVEATALGGRAERIAELREKWGLTDEDGAQFAERSNLKLWRDGDQFCAAFHDFVNIQESQVGFGRTAVDAFADLARQGGQL
jgi:hypothetical protein